MDSPTAVRIAVPATSANLGPGFDTLGLAINLWLEVVWEPAPQTHVHVLGEGAGDLPNDTSNLIYQVAAGVLDRLRRQPPPGGRLTIQNRIPVSRGLGSSAAAVVAGVILGHHWAGEPLDAQRCLEWAWPYEGHMDNVAPAIVGGVTLVWQGEDTQGYRRLDAPPFPIVLAVPDFKVSTRRARDILPPWVSRSDAVFNAQRVGLWVYALARHDWDVLRWAAEDRLHQAARSPLIPGLKSVLRAAQAEGAKMATLSGSGSTVLALVDGEHVVRVAEVMGEQFRAYGIRARILVTRASPKGASPLQEPPSPPADDPPRPRLLRLGRPVP
ncbi:MAG: homoserine kinase [Firmicutes bacterium]|nr:homoserine kinase [Bacillota bacterium]